jgi:hypothetical protein
VIGKALICVLWIVFLSGQAVGYQEQVMGERGGEKGMSGKAVGEALRKHTDELLSLPGVVGTGQGLCDGRPCIKVYVVKKAPELEEEIHRLLDPCPLSIEETGRFRSLPNKEP